ncbi:His-Me finger endonuclease [Anaeromyces robustus]|uniref:His-Me finger endonuclease n=1 Tax=Anaeromyces robustus TaxID=1754192 RepID=A0A1Y1VU43_9FUNG|nr:His-Me finger endonuclease [Anaeromyces robustus]|eukprot:ORX64828.1 His-Me finger endonuclease [Anaeromyces robustus]
MKRIITIVFCLIIEFVYIVWAKQTTDSKPTIQQGDVKVTLLNNHQTTTITSPSGRYSVIYAIDYQNPEVALAYLDYDEFGGSGRYSGKFKPLNAPSTVKVRHTWYNNSGYDRGHLISNDFFNFDEQLAYETFAVYNICPQTPGLNRNENGYRAWRQLENAAEKAYANAYGRVYVITGPIFDKSPSYYNKLPKRDCVIPERFYKIILVQDLKDESFEFTRLETYFFENKTPNKGESVDLKDCLVYETTQVEQNIDVIESLLNIKITLL